jgi:N-acetyl-gamma-glutamyl-phosphate reductase
LPELQHYSLLDQSPIFVPSVGDFAQGMVVQIPLQLSMLKAAPSRADLHAALQAHYADCKGIDVLPLDADQGRIDPQALNNTNRMRLSVLGSSEKNQAILTAVLDNLGKGASGAAVQNLEIMLGLTN